MTDMPLNATANPIAVIEMMTEIWDNDPSDLYDEWHNARKVMKALGATQVGNPSKRGDEAWIAYCLPAGGRVFVQVNGAGIRLPKWGTLR